MKRDWRYFDTHFDERVSGFFNHNNTETKMTLVLLKFFVPQTCTSDIFHYIIPITTTCFANLILGVR